MRSRIILSVIVLLLTVGLLPAERPPQDQRIATDVVTGTVEKLTTKESAFGGDGVRTDFTATVKVDKVERGENVKPGGTIKVTWFHVTKRPSRLLPAAYGHGYGVKEKDAIRAYLLKD